jgi:hypothetical protein
MSFEGIPRKERITEDAYAVLGLAPGASAGEVKRAYRDRAKECHPDAGGSSADFRRLQEAYEEALEAQRTGATSQDERAATKPESTLTFERRGAHTVAQKDGVYYLVEQKTQQLVGPGYSAIETLPIGDIEVLVGTESGGETFLIDRGGRPRHPVGYTSFETLALSDQQLLVGVSKGGTKYPINLRTGQAIGYGYEAYRVENGRFVGITRDGREVDVDIKTGAATS